MKLSRVLLCFLLLPLFFAAPVVAGDFDWLKELEVKAKTDLSGFRTTLATRFNVGDAQIKLVFSNVREPSDAYMVLRLGELSHRPTDYVIHHYHAHKGEGWGALAKSLGIKPGSKEFHALKAGHDLHRGHEHHHDHEHHGHGEDHGKGAGKSK